MTTKAHYKELAKATRQEAEFAKKAETFREAVNKRTAEYREAGYSNAGRAALQELRDEDPEGFAAFQEWDDAIEKGSDHDAGAEIDNTVNKRMALDRKVEKAVADVRSRDGCTRQEAMQQARDENPDLFDEWQSHHSAL
jgi:hypothetical protein